VEERHSTRGRSTKDKVVRTKQGESTKAKSGRNSVLCPFPVALSFVLITLSLGLLSCSSRSRANGRGVEVSVRPGLSIRALADTLAAKHIIGSKPLFLFYAWYYNYGHRIRPGRFRFQVGAGERRALKLLSGEEPALVTVTIPEGYTMNQVAAALDERDICRADSFLSACLDTNVLREFDVSDATAEGYLFPETYEFLTGSPPPDVVRRMLRQFFSVFSELRTQTPGPQSLTPAQTVILASIVEREAKVPEEYPRIAGVFVNRLRRHLPLQSCATVEYLLPERKGRLSVDDTRIESPYNTYLHVGLPPGPICSPGRRALAAALNPERNDYLFFVARGDGTYAFFCTAAEHAANCRALLDN
jgi:UPF0755 protein